MSVGRKKSLGEDFIIRLSSMCIDLVRRDLKVICMDVVMQELEEEEKEEKKTEV